MIEIEKGRRQKARLHIHNRYKLNNIHMPDSVFDGTLLDWALDMSLAQLNNRQHHGVVCRTLIRFSVHSKPFPLPRRQIKLHSFIKEEKRHMVPRPPIGLSE